MSEPWAGAEGFRLSVDHQNLTPPPFEQVKQQIRDGAAGGILPLGTRLPSVRALAADLGLAANTVAKAYRELEAEGVLVTRGRGGTFVAAADRTRAARLATHDYVRAVRALGLTREQVEDLLARAWEN